MQLDHAWIWSCSDRRESGVRQRQVLGGLKIPIIFVEEMESSVFVWEVSFLSTSTLILDKQHHSREKRENVHVEPTLSLSVNHPVCTEVSQRETTLVHI